MQKRFIAILCSLCASLAAAAGPEASTVELIRDHWGTPHVFSATDEGAMYGLGYAAAEDRGFQMYYALRIMQGRLAELLGENHGGRNRLSPVESDRMMRTFGFARKAEEIVGNLDADTRTLLAAYAQGVNDFFREHPSDRHELFGQFGIVPEPWTPADCLLSWWHMAKFFSHDGLGDRHRPEDVQKELENLRTARQFVDDDMAVIHRTDVSDAWVRATDEFARKHGLTDGDGDRESTGPKFSHAWVVGGRRTTTGSAVLVSDPQTPVASPSFFYEFHASGRTFNARGIGAAGSPMLLIGFTKHVAWGATALAADQADLFRLKADPARPNQYELDGVWRPMDVREETIHVRDAEPVSITVRESHFGPVVTDLLRKESDGEEFASRRVPTCITDGETIEAAMAMWRARDAFAFHEALSGWHFPSANCVFGDSQGNIGYTTLGAVPVRPPHAEEFGTFAFAGHESAHNWQGMIPHELVPHVLNPDRGTLWTGNHRVIGRFYKLGIHGSTGETTRSRRLREMLEAQETFNPEDVLAMHFESTNPSRRDLVRLGLHLRRIQPDTLSDDARNALNVLDSWYHAGATSSLTVPGAELAVLMHTEFRSRFTPLADQFGGGDAGMSRFLRDVTGRIDRDRDLRLTELEAEYTNRVLSEAWTTACERYGPVTQTWLQQARDEVGSRKLEYYQSLDGFGSLDPEHDLAIPTTLSNDGATIFAQPTQSYTQYVPLHDADRALAILPIGSSERPGSPYRTSTLDDWTTGQMHPAPLTRDAVRRIQENSRVLQPRLAP